MLSRFSRVQFFVILWTAARQAPVHGILRARILEWVAMPFSRGSSRPRDQTHVSCIGRRVLYHCATGTAHMVFEILIYGCVRSAVEPGISVTHGLHRGTWPAGSSMSALRLSSCRAQA